MDDQSKYMRMFNEQMLAMLNKIKVTYPEERDFVMLYDICETYTKINPVRVMRAFGKFANPYRTQIMNKDLEFFMNKKYEEDMDKDKEVNARKDEILFKIEYFKNVLVAKSSDTTREAIWKYMQVLIKLMDKYHGTS